MPDFADAIVLVTGASSGIGAATARLLQSRGAALIVIDRDAAGLEAFPAARRLVGDVADPELWARADLTGLTHAVLNAGIVGSAGGRTEIADLDFAVWRQVMTTNLDGTLLSLRAAMRALRDAGRGGSIMLTASAAGLKVQPGVAAYATSKAAIIHLAKLAACEGAPHQIRVNAIAPAGVETPIWTNLPFFDELADETGGEAGAFAQLGETIPLGRFAKAEEVAEQIAFLLSDKAGTITGTCLVADGGYSF
jgi:NAD(P)-dependent dehydrogenase (short-subunit alcohol dehydrogenase family)